MALIQLSIRAFAELWEVDERTVRNWTKSGCPKTGGRGTGKPLRYDENSILWVYDNVELRSRKRNGKSDTALDIARARKADRQADVVEIQLAEMRGELVPKNAAKAALERICTEIRAQLLTIPSKWSPQLAGLTRREVQVELQKAVDEALEALSAGMEIPARDKRSGPPKRKGSGRATTKRTRTRKS